MMMMVVTITTMVKIMWDDAVGSGGGGCLGQGSVLRNPGNIFTATNNPVMQPPPLMSQHYSYAMHLSIFLGLFECVGIQQYTFQNTTQT